ncbi:MAG: hypothetical protein JSW34_13195 [Candidatus Zixiibacteriota bacterium]|nr:MAG: hypothetical protein JSW34_13195 [candidate division Zixibacteria bacterium]
MQRRLILTIIIIFMAGGYGSAGAFEMAPTPVQDQMAAALASMQGSADSQFDDFTEPPAASNSGPSTLKAIALSALLPGAGEYYLGNRGKARYFFGVEAVTWVGFFTFRTYGGWKKDDYIGLAAQRADAQLDDKDDEFLDWVGFYQSIDEYNTLGRVSDPDRPYLEDTPENHWYWQSVEDQMAYRDLKNRSREAYRRSNFMIGLAVLSRVVSVIDVVREARRVSRQGDEDFTRIHRPTYRVELNPLSRNRQITITLFTSF